MAPLVKENPPWRRTPRLPRSEFRFTGESPEGWALIRIPQEGAKMCGAFEDFDQVAAPAGGLVPVGKTVCEQRIEIPEIRRIKSAEFIEFGRPAGVVAASGRLVHRRPEHRDILVSANAEKFPRHDCSRTLRPSGLT
ncbi:hypothetical protein [Streptomyces litchfieldiae]|uniref:Uncharacterized protein n=1 Tax=Streptomyces litchfieldiae TaxID=3075543 RepID=A0ABU2MWB2_9ACTN|nr:hypothetical protein [Streptomyces sp. DSM 44938]MDT0345374.1 hypothetical protein [Streptomyces sp. DSM 44938]